MAKTVIKLIAIKYSMENKQLAWLTSWLTPWIPPANRRFKEILILFMLMDPLEFRVAWLSAQIRSLFSVKI
jgi:hypothetical protein